MSYVIRELVSDSVPSYQAVVTIIRSPHRNVASSRCRTNISNLGRRPTIELDSGLAVGINFDGRNISVEHTLLSSRCLPLSCTRRLTGNIYSLFPFF